MNDNILRRHAEDEFAEELHELARVDKHTRPPNWNMSPWAVVTYLMGGELDNKFVVLPKYIGSRRLMEIAVAAARGARHRQIVGIRAFGRRHLR